MCTLRRVALLPWWQAIVPPYSILFRCLWALPGGLGFYLRRNGFPMITSCWTIILGSELEEFLRALLALRNGDPKRPFLPIPDSLSCRAHAGFFYFL